MEQAVVEDVPMDPEQQAAMEEEWRVSEQQFHLLFTRRIVNFDLIVRSRKSQTELAKTEDEINTLKQVLASKQAEAAELKRKLGITAWNEWQTSIVGGVQNLKETTA